MPDRYSKKSGTATPDIQTVPSEAPALGDYRLTVDLVATINSQLGALTEAINTLKGEHKDTRDKLDEVRMDISGVKTAAKLLIGTVAIVGLVIAYLQFMGSSRSPQPAPPPTYSPAAATGPH